MGGEKWPGNEAIALITVLSLDIPIKVHQHLLLPTVYDHHTSEPQTVWWSVGQGDTNFHSRSPHSYPDTFVHNWRGWGTWDGP